MKYERLTKKFENGYVMADCTNCPSCNKCDDITHYCQTTIKERLAELEDKIEQGLMIELPCVRERKGYPNQYEAVYEINGVVQSCIVSSVKEGWKIISYYGEDRAKVEAKKRLKELQGDKE